MEHYNRRQRMEQASSVQQEKLVASRQGLLGNYEELFVPVQPSLLP